MVKYMFLSFLTSPFKDWSLQKIVDWVSANGFKGLEISVSPTVKHIDVDYVLSGEAGEIRRLFSEKELNITSLAFYSINILENPEEQKFY